MIDASGNPRLTDRVSQAVAIPGVEWSVMVRDDLGSALTDVQADRRLYTASIGKVLLLIEAARQLERGWGA